MVSLSDKIEELLKSLEYVSLSQFYIQLQHCEEAILEVISASDMSPSYGPELKARLKFIGFDTSFMKMALEKYKTRVLEVTETYQKLNESMKEKA